MGKYKKGKEYEYCDLSDYDDGQGNNISEGDQSVQKMVERGWTPGPDGKERK